MEFLLFLGNCRLNFSFWWSSFLCFLLDCFNLGGLLLVSSWLFSTSCLFGNNCLLSSERSSLSGSDSFFLNFSLLVELSLSLGHFLGMSLLLGSFSLSSKDVNLFLQKLLLFIFPLSWSHYFWHGFLLFFIFFLLSGLILCLFLFQISFLLGNLSFQSCNFSFLLFNFLLLIFSWCWWLWCFLFLLSNWWITLNIFLLLFFNKLLWFILNASWNNCWWLWFLWYFNISGSASWFLWWFLLLSLFLGCLLGFLSNS